LHIISPLLVTIISASSCPECARKIDVYWNSANKYCIMRNK
jgi:hypothetical protein